MSSWDGVGMRSFLHRSCCSIRLALSVAAPVIALTSACAESSAAPDDDGAIAQEEDALGVDSPAASEIADAVVAHAAPRADVSGATLLHKCTSRGNVRPKIRIEVYAFERTDPWTATGAVVVCARGKRIAVPAQISPADGSGYYWNEDSAFEVGGKKLGISINDPEDYGYTESATGQQLELGCTPAPRGWGPWN
jgi:hypothetical protein